MGSNIDNLEEARTCALVISHVVGQGDEVLPWHGHFLAIRALSTAEDPVAWPERTSIWNGRVRRDLACELVAEYEGPGRLHLVFALGLQDLLHAKSIYALRAGMSETHVEVVEACAVDVYEDLPLTRLGFGDALGDGNLGWVGIVVDHEGAHGVCYSLAVVREVDRGEGRREGEPRAVGDIRRLGRRQGI